MFPFVVHLIFTERTYNTSLCVHFTKWYISPNVVLILLFLAERLQDFMVSVSDNEPPASSGFNLLYKSAGYRPCGQYKGNPPTLEPVYMECARGAVGRYAYLLMPHYNHMHCAAFEAFGVRKYGYTRKQKYLQFFITGCTEGCHIDNFSVQPVMKLSSK